MRPPISGSQGIREPIDPTPTSGATVLAKELRPNAFSAGDLEGLSLTPLHQHHPTDCRRWASSLSWDASAIVLLQNQPSLLNKVPAG